MSKAETNIKTFFSNYLEGQASKLSAPLSDFKISIVFFSDKPSVMLFVRDKYKNNVAIDKEAVEDIKDYFNILKTKYHVVFIQSMKVEFNMSTENLIITSVFKEGVLIS